MKKILLVIAIFFLLVFSPLAFAEEKVCIWSHEDNGDQSWFMVDLSDVNAYMKIYSDGGWNPIIVPLDSPGCLEIPDNPLKKEDK